MRAGKVQFSRGEKGSRKVMTRFVSIILLVSGFILCQPFFWIVLMSETTFHYITLPVLLMIVSFIFGLPMFFAGIVGMLVGNKSNYSASSYNDHDVSRVRHAVETDAMNRR